MQQVSSVHPRCDGADELDPGGGRDLEVDRTGDPGIEQLAVQAEPECSERADGADVRVEVDEESAGGGVAELGGELVPDALLDVDVDAVGRGPGENPLVRLFSVASPRVTRWSTKTT